MAEKRSDSGRLRLEDPAGVAMIIRQRIKERHLLDPLDPLLTSKKFRRDFWGAKTSILRATAEETGISRITLHRLVHGKTSACSWRTLTRLLRWIGEEFEEQLSVCAVGADTAEARASYTDFLARERQRMDEDRTEEDSYPLVQGSEVAKTVAEFRKYVKDLGLPAPREELALLRVFDAIVAWRPLRDRLSEKEVAKLVRQGLRREKTLVREEARILGLWDLGQSRRRYS